MSTESFSTLFDNLIAEASRTAAADPASFAPTEPVEAEGTAYDERIRVKIVNGEVTEFEVQPHALRLDNATLGEELAVAVNTALKAYQQAMLEAIQGETSDLGKLQTQLREVQTESMRTIGNYSDAMLEMLRKAKQP